MLCRHMWRAVGDHSTSGVAIGAPVLKMAAKAAGDSARARRRSWGDSRRWTVGRTGDTVVARGARDEPWARGGEEVDEMSFSLSCWRDNNRSWGRFG